MSSAAIARNNKAINSERVRRAMGGNGVADKKIIHECVRPKIVTDAGMLKYRGSHISLMDIDVAALLRNK